MPSITPFLSFETEALEAAEFYTSIFPNSSITAVSRYGDAGPGPAGSVMVVEFLLDGQRFTALNGGPSGFNQAISLMVDCEESELDHYFDRLTDGGQPGPCGWLQDRYGLSWQLVPRGFMEIMSDPDPERAGRAMQAMQKMSKLDLPTLRAAAAGG